MRCIPVRTPDGEDIEVDGFSFICLIDDFIDAIKSNDEKRLVELRRVVIDYRLAQRRPTIRKRRRKKR